MKTSPKINSFWRRVIKDFILYKDVTEKRHMDIIPFCEICGAEAETTSHALFKCERVLLFWNKVELLTGVKIPSLHPHSWTMDIIDDSVVEEKNACLILCGMSSIWKARKDILHDERVSPIAKFVLLTMPLTYGIRSSKGFLEPNPRPQAMETTLDGLHQNKCGCSL